MNGSVRRGANKRFAKGAIDEKKHNYPYTEGKTRSVSKTNPVEKERDRFIFFADTIPLIIWIADKDGKPEYFNRYWSEYTGCTSEASVENDLLTNLIHPDDRERVIKHWKESLVSGNTLEIEYRLKHKSGNYKWFLRRVSAVKDTAGKIVRWVSACTDIDAQKKLEQKLRESGEQLELNVEERTKELKKSNEDLEQFAFVASHDLKEPLRMIASYTDLILEKSAESNEELQEFWGYVRDGVKQMTSLIDDLLDYSRIGRLDVEFSSINLNNLIGNVLDSLSKSINETGAKIHTDPLPVISGSPTLIRQLFQNLIENAIKFRKEGEKPIIHISATKQNQEWLFAIRDNGIGLEPRFADRIFIVFQRLQTRDRYKGTGIGLSICKKVVEFHHGTIWVESKPGEGATFYFTLPENPPQPVPEISQ